MAQTEYAVREIHDPMRLRRWAWENLRENHRALPDHRAPCPHRCSYCDRCKRAFWTAARVFGHPSVVVYEVEREGRAVGCLFFTKGTILHGFFTDGQLLGKGPAIRQAVERRSLEVGETVEAWVPESSETVARWLCRHGFEHDRTREADFLKDQKRHDVEVLTWAS